jgi:hypothetical protein
MEQRQERTSDDARSHESVNYKSIKAGIVILGALNKSPPSTSNATGFDQPLLREKGDETAYSSLNFCKATVTASSYVSIIKAHLVKAESI